MANKARKRVDEMSMPMPMVAISLRDRQRGANLSTVSAAAGKKVCSNRNKVINEASTTTSYKREWVSHEPRANNAEGEDDVNVIEARRKKHKCGRQLYESWSLFYPSPGGPHDISVIPSFGGHVARHIWDGNDRGVLNCLSRGKALQQLRGWKLVDEAALDLVTDSGLSHLIDCMFEHLDMPLLSAFVERWQPDTNTFHLPFGEMTIMLHDVFYILGIPVDGIVVENENSGGQWSDLCKLLNLDHQCPSQGLNFKAIWSRGGVLLDGILQYCSRQNVTSKDQAGGYLLYLLGSTLFVDNSGDRMRNGFTAIMRNADRICEYAWGAATLAYLYRQLGIATRADAFEICGCLTLLQAWIYEYFPIFRPARGRQLQSAEPLAKVWNTCEASKRDIDSLRLYRSQLDQLTSKQVTWLPYGQDPSVTVPRTIFTGFLRCLDIIEPYHPDRVLRQLGYIQVVPSQASLPELDSRCRNPRKYSVNFPAKHTNIMWLNGRFHQLPLSDFETATDPSHPSAVSADYMDWYHQVSHPFLIDNYNGRSSFLWMSELVKRLQPALSWPQEQRHETVKELFATLDDVGEFVQLWHQACNGPGPDPPSYPPPTLT